MTGPMRHLLSRHLLAEAYNNGWANHRLLRACAQLSQADFVAPRSAFFPSIKATLNHIVTVDWFYIDALEREARGALPHPDFRGEFFAVAEPCETCTQLWVAQREADRRLTDYCKSLRDDELGRVVTIDRGEGHLQRDSRERLLGHLFEHHLGRAEWIQAAFRRRTSTRSGWALPADYSPKRFATSSSITSVAPPPIASTRASRTRRSIGLSRM